MGNDNGGDIAMMDFDLGQPEAPVRCPLCPEIFVVVPDSQPLQHHLLKYHSLVIAKIYQIADLRQYLMYWRKLSTGDMVNYCSVILTNSDQDSKQGDQQLYFLLSDNLTEDRVVRGMLTDLKLKAVTKFKEQERADATFSRKCVYCYDVVGGGLHNVFAHLTNKHSFSIGKPDNIVFGARLLDAIEEKFQNLQCLYCEKKFPHHEVLRIHMRKKGHRTLNPANRFYDQFYLINYLQPGTPWQQLKNQRDDEAAPVGARSNSDEEGGMGGGGLSLDEMWTDWREETQPATCLFCPYTTSKVPVGLQQHMTAQHSFDFKLLTRDFSFYDKVRLVNYIRTKMQQLQCPACGSSHSTVSALQQHLNDASHCRLPTPTLWCSEKYLQPAMAEDGLLCHLEDPQDVDHCQQVECEVFGEDIARVSMSPEVARELSADSGFFSSTVSCLFCRQTALGGQGVHDIILHMHSIHAFDLYQVTKGLQFYGQVCLINYIRSCGAASQCYYCGEHFNDPRVLEEHRTVLGHTIKPAAHLYSDERYMNPVLPDDPLLQELQEDTWTDDSDLSDDDASVLEAARRAGQHSTPHLPRERLRSPARTTQQRSPITVSEIGKNWDSGGTGQLLDASPETPSSNMSRSAMLSDKPGSSCSGPSADRLNKTGHANWNLDTFQERQLPQQSNGLFTGAVDSFADDGIASQVPDWRQRVNGHDEVSIGAVDAVNSNGDGYWRQQGRKYCKPPQPRDKMESLPVHQSHLSNDWRQPSNSRLDNGAPILGRTEYKAGNKHYRQSTSNGKSLINQRSNTHDVILMSTDSAGDGGGSKHTTPDKKTITFPPSHKSTPAKNGISKQQLQTMRAKGEIYKHFHQNDWNKAAKHHTTNAAQAEAAVIHLQEMMHDLPPLE